MPSVQTKSDIKVFLVLALIAAMLIGYIIKQDSNDKIKTYMSFWRASGNQFYAISAPALITERICLRGTDRGTRLNLVLADSEMTVNQLSKIQTDFNEKGAPLEATRLHDLTNELYNAVIKDDSLIRTMTARHSSEARLQREITLQSKTEEEIVSRVASEFSRIKLRLSQNDWLRQLWSKH